MTQNRWLGVAALMVTPIAMAFLSLTLNYIADRWANIILPVVFSIFNFVGLPSYRSAHDRFLIIVGLAFNVLTFGYAWTWV